MPSTESRPTGVGIVGLGFIGRTHLRALAALEARGAPCRVVAICESDPARRSGLASAGAPDAAAGSGLFDPARVRAVAHPDELFTDPGVAISLICTPTDTHVDLAVRALRAGQHVLVEKPVALAASEIERLAEVARAADRLCMPAMCMRFWPGWAWLRDRVRDGVLGRVHSAVFRRLGSRPGWSDFYGDRGRSGGALFDLHVHDADFISWCFGPPDSVTATGTPDHLTALYAFAGGPAHVVAEGGWDHDPGLGFRMRYTVVFERATADWDLRRDPPLLLHRNGVTESPPLPAETAYEAQARQFLEGVRTGSVGALPTLAEAARVTRTLERVRSQLRPD
ncbi:MAG TPA: Gfo/Idh/MocA family oxidoreductase [Phycisphaerales bacterium]|nr:Gfo/Idh/MocA family oxidoreductase [Phycisphaerales bacterium]